MATSGTLSHWFRERFPQLQTLVGSQGQGVELVYAGAMLSILIPLTVFFAMQRFFVRGIVITGVEK